MPNADNAPLRRDEHGTPKASKPSRVWLWFVAAFVVQAIVWVAWLTIAAKNRVEEVPVVSSPR